jgi:hypothetical protein
VGPHHPLGCLAADEGFEQLPNMLNSFWETVDLGEVWAQVKPMYVEEIHRYDLDLMTRQLHFIWQYLRMQRDDNDVLVQIPNLLGSHYSVCRVRHDNCLCSIEGPDSVDHTLSVHEYLHSIVNEIVTEHYPGYAEKLRAYCIAENNEPLAESYEDPVVFTYECLVRALDRRMRILLSDNVGQTQAHKDAVQRDTRKGLTLTQPFLALLAEFEKGSMPFDQFVPIMFEQLPDNYTYALKTTNLPSNLVSSAAGLARQEERKPFSVDSFNAVAGGYTSLCLEQ